MIELEKLQEHLKSLKPKDWDKLFSLLPEIETMGKLGEVEDAENLEDGAMTTLNWDWPEIVHTVLRTFNELNLLPAFNWTNWQEGKNILLQNDFDFNQLDTFTLCKLLTTLVRVDRFNEGFLVSRFENGTILNIIKAIKRNET